ncbi:MAG: hypothetical protein KC457_05910 [Myxococcales bacterium]|nr:hypothetical protein [Myxococcales bacterium]
MSTDLYGVRVLAVDPEARRIRLRVFVVYYDTHYGYHQPVPENSSFFVRALCDHDAFGDDIAQDDRFDEAWVSANAFRTIERFEELARRNEPVEDYAAYSDFYYERGGGWVDEDKLVQADFDLFVTKAEYLAVFHEGMSWGTTAYQTEADELSWADYPEIPDFGDARTVTAFPDGKEDGSTLRSMLFSADSKHLLLASDDGDLRVIRVEDAGVVLEVPKLGSWDMAPGWTADGRVGACVRGEHVAIDLAGKIEPFSPFGCGGNAAGTRFFAVPHDDDLRLLDQRGEVLLTLPGAPDLVIVAGYDAEAKHCALLVETRPLQLVDLASGETRELDAGRVNSVSMSPDGRYLVASTFEALLVIRVADGRVIRRRTVKPRYPTAVAWSPDGELVATSITDDRGYHSTISFHRLGRALLAAESAPQAVPAPRSLDLRDLARLYLDQTRNFSRGWSSHLDDDLLDMHLALARMGLELDLVPHMHADPTRIAARAYEAVIAHGRGEHERARSALADAEARRDASEIEGWAHTFVHAPLAAAQFVLGADEAATASLEKAQIELGEEANRFQKRAVLARALLVMGRIDEVAALVRAESTTWVGDFHIRLLVDLVDAGAFELLREAWEQWNASEEWDAGKAVLRALRQRDALAEAEALDLDADDDDGDDGDDDEDDAGDTGEDDIDPASLEPFPRVGWLGARGRWDEAYAVVDATKKTLRNPLVQQIVDAACKRGDLHIMLDALARLPCGDMNAPGLRAMQRSFRGLAGAAYRKWHP